MLTTDMHVSWLNSFWSWKILVLDIIEWFSEGGQTKSVDAYILEPFHFSRLEKEQSISHTCETTPCSLDMVRSPQYYLRSAYARERLQLITCHFRFDITVSSNLEEHLSMKPTSPCPLWLSLYRYIINDIVIMFRKFCWTDCEMPVMTAATYLLYVRSKINDLKFDISRIKTTHWDIHRVSAQF